MNPPMPDLTDPVRYLGASAALLQTHISTIDQNDNFRPERRP
jgi:hypothetical protein